MPDEYDQLLDSVLPRPRRGNYDEIINRHAQRTGLDADLIKAVMGQESGGNPNATSPKGAKGPMQLMDVTAKRFGVTNPRDPEQAIRGGADYLKFLSDRYQGNRDLVLAGYNAGEGNVDKYHGIPPFRETQNYVRSISKKLGSPSPPKRDAYDDLLDEVSKPQSDEYDALLDGVAREPSPPPITSALDSLNQYVNRRTRAIQPPKQTSYADLKRNEYPSDLSLGELRRAEDEQGQPSRVNQTSDELRVMKGEQPVNRQSYSRQQDAQTRLPGARTQVFNPPQEPNVIRPLTRTERLRQRAGEIVQDYVPGLANVDTPEGISTAFPRGIASGLTLGAIGQPQGGDSSEEALPGLTRHGLGEVVGALGPLLLAGQALPSSLSPAVRTAATFGLIGAGRQAVNAAEGRPVDVTAPLEETALGLVMGRLEGIDPTIKRRVIAYIIPGIALDVAKGASAEDAAKRAGVNLAFALAGENKGGVENGNNVRPMAETPIVSETTPRMAESVAPDAGTREANARVAQGMAQPEPSDVVARDGETKQRFHSLQFGDVEVTDSQEGARAGRLRVAEVNDPTKIHYVKKADRQGRGNAQLLPIKESSPVSVPASESQSPATIPVESAGEGVVAPEVIPSRLENQSINEAKPSQLPVQGSESQSVEPSVREGEAGKINAIGKFYQRIQSTSQKDYGKRTAFLEGYLDLDKQRREVLDKMLGYESGHLQHDRLDKELDRVDGALNLQVDQGAKHFGITPTEFIDLVNDFESDSSAVKTALMPKTPDQPSTSDISSNSERRIREPWQMTKAAVLEHAKADLERLPWREKNDPEWVKSWMGNQEIRHRSQVITALRDGKQVPSNVLADYPDIDTEGLRGRKPFARSQSAESEVAAKNTATSVEESGGTPTRETLTSTPESPKRGERSLPKSLEAAGLPSGTERFYDVKSNVESENNAREIIKGKGVEGATNWVQSGEKPSTEQSATALELIRGLAKEAETESNPEIKAAKLMQAAELSSTMSVRGTEAGQAIQYFATLAKESPEGALYYAERTVRRKNPDVGLSEGQRTEVFDLATKLKSTETELETVRQQLESALKVKGPRKQSEVTTKIREWANQAERDARARLASRTGVKGSQAGATTILPDIADYSIIGAAKLARGTVEFAEWSKQMVSEFGDDVKPYLRQIRTESQKLLDQQSRVARSGKTVDEIARLGTERGADQRVIDTANEILKGASRTELHRKVKAEHGLTTDETNVLVGRAQKLYADANRGLREAGKERSALKREPDASPERVRELTAERDKLLAARGKLRRELISFQKRLEEGAPSFGRRANNAFRGLVVSAVQTASRNLGTQSLRASVESLTDAFELAVVKAKVKAGGKVKEGDIDPNTSMLDTLKSSAYLFQRNKRLVNGILDEFPIEHEQMFKQFSSDVELATKNPLAKGADKVMGHIERGIEIANTFNRAQEFIGRRAVFRGVLEARLRAQGIDLNKTIKQGRQEIIPREDIQAAVESALKVTFAESPKAGTKSDMFVRFTSSLPAPVNPLTFSRFLWNGAKFTAEYQPTTALRGLYRTARGEPGAARDYAKAAVGTVMLTTAVQIYDHMHKDDSEWYLLVNPVTGNEFDIRPYQPFASYIFAAHFLRSKQKGEKISYEPNQLGRMGVYVEGLTGFQGRPNPAWEGLKSITSENWDGVTNAIKRQAGETVAATLTPLKTPKQILSAFDKSEGIMRNTRERPFQDPIINAIPKLSQNLEPVTRKGKEVRQPSPLLQPLGIREIDPDTKYTRAENYMRSIIQAKYGDDERTQAEIDRSRQASKLRDRSRNGEDVSKELDALDLPKRQRTSIEASKGLSTLQEDFKRLDIHQALETYKLMNRGERASIKEQFAAKADRALPNLSESEQEDVKKQLEAIGMSETEGRKPREPRERQPRTERKNSYFQFASP